MPKSLFRHCLHLLLALSLSLTGVQAIASHGATTSSQDAIGATEMAHHGQIGHHARCADTPPLPQAKQDDAEPFKRRRVEIALTQWQTPTAADPVPLQALTAAVPAAARTPLPADAADNLMLFQACFLRACRGRAPPVA